MRKVQSGGGGNGGGMERWEPRGDTKVREWSGDQTDDRHRRGFNLLD